MANIRSFPSTNSASLQRSGILQYLTNTGPITKLECSHIVDFMHPGMRICELRKAGYFIATMRVNDFTQEDYTHQVAKYGLVGKKQITLFDRQEPKEVR